MSPLIIASIAGLAALAAIVLRVPGGDIAALVVGLGALVAQGVAIGAEPTD